MKRFHILTIASLLFSASVVVAYDCNAGVVDHAKTDISFSIDLCHSVPIVKMDCSALIVEPFAMVFVSNFNGLVIFPELGNEALYKGFANLSRGPPKS